MNVSSVKNLNGETFSAVQDATLTDVVQSNSASWSQGGGNPEVESYVQTNSGMIDETITSYQTNSSTYMVEPNLEYNAVGEISGYGSSAIAQYGAEKQWLVHDDTIVHVANSAQYAFGCNISALQRLMGIDETVLYTGNSNVTAFTASEPLTNFREVIFYVSPNPDTTVAKLTLPMVGHNTSSLGLTYNSTWAGFAGGIQISTEYNHVGMSAFQLAHGAWFGWAATGATTGTYYDACIYKIIGIGRKQ